MGMRMILIRRIGWRWISEFREAFLVRGFCSAMHLYLVTVPILRLDYFSSLIFLVSF